MARVTPAEVKVILDNTELSDAVLTAYITGANAMVTSVLGDADVPASVLKEIERWLAAHMVAVSRERTAEAEEAGGARVKYTGQYGTGLASTPYGQMVMALDPTGKMATTGKRAVSFYAVPEGD